MKEENFQQMAADDGLYIDSDTTVAEIQAFMKRRAHNPVKYQDTVIWDFCGFERDEDALREAVKYKLKSDRYLIPFQVTGTWGFMYHMLPERLKDAEILVYDARQNTYKGYTNYSRMMSREQTRAFRQDLAKRVADAEPDPILWE